MADKSPAAESIPERSTGAQPEATAILPELSQPVQPIGGSVLSGRATRSPRSRLFFPDPTINHYPADFDDTDREKIKVAEILVTASIKEKKDSVQSPAERDNLLLRDWVLPIFAVASELACERVRSGLWRVHKAEPEMLKYLGYLTRAAGLNSETEWMVGDRTPVIRADIQSQIDRSAEWNTHLQRLVGSQSAQAKATQDPAPKGDQEPEAISGNSSADVPAPTEKAAELRNSEAAAASTQSDTEGPSNIGEQSASNGVSLAAEDSLPTADSLLSPNMGIASLNRRGRPKKSGLKEAVRTATAPFGDAWSHGENLVQVAWAVDKAGGLSSRDSEPSFDIPTEWKSQKSEDGVPIRCFADMVEKNRKKVCEVFRGHIS
jgi:hypothetical protein